MSANKSREIRLKKRPVGLPVPSDFELVETAVPGPAAGQVLVRNIVMSVDPYMRARMTDRDSYLPAFRLGEALSGRAVGQVAASNGNADFRVGDYVSHFSGWREWFTTDGSDLQKIDPALAPLSAYLGTFGMPGLTAYGGLLKVGEAKEGERVFVSAAAGAVGSVVCQIAKNKGCYVVGSAGSDEKCDWLVKEAGFDAAIDYKREKVGKALSEHCKKGINIYFDNVGGEILDDVLARIAFGARIVLCGAISQYNEMGVSMRGPKNYMNLVLRGARMEGFLVFQFASKNAQAIADLTKWHAEGKIINKIDLAHGLENCPKTIIRLFTGANFGKQLLKVADPQ
ncbi:MAG TPA: NADP-dependent oxidoreductase [Candidatus Binataceae bacterium]|nr:NADP-dependent oxidoreductase [Candidatus Binataceae bacterium]